MGDLLAAPWKGSFRPNYWWPWLTIIQTPDGHLRAARYDEEFTEDQVVGFMSLSGVTSRIGLHAPVIKRFPATYRVRAQPGYTIAQVEAFQGEFLSGEGGRWLDRMGFRKAETDQLLSKGAYTKIGLLPAGIAHDAITLSTLLLLVYSMRLNRMRWRDAKRQRASQCPHCRYSIVGLPSNVCPECGHNFSTHSQS